MAVRRPNLVFQQTINGASGFELLEAPFEKDFADITELAFFVGGEFFEFGAQRLTDPQADLYFPFAHWLPSSVRGECAACDVCVAFR
jgi:hypothetical protein